MSSRNFRKLYGDAKLPSPDESSEEEYLPSCVTNSIIPKFQGLVLSSESEAELVGIQAGTAATTQAPTRGAIPKATNKKNQRKGKHGRVVSNDDALDEIDKCVKEVNDTLGEPSRLNQSQEKIADPRMDLMTILPKHLNYENELRRVFGPEDGEEVRRQRQSNRTRLNKGIVVPPITINARLCKGLSMTLDHTRDGFNYFLFNHNLEYQKKFRVILKRLMWTSGNTPRINEAEIALYSTTIEGILENADTLLQHEEYTAGTKSIEQAIMIMQSIQHPSFNLTDPKTRLEYKYFENRIFHVTVLKYLHLLTNKACHRTALELAKVLLNLDPSDPLAVVLIIDTLALRAREYQWFINIVDHWSEGRNVGFLFNIQYSYALAHFHVAFKDKEDLSTADKLLQAAILAYPTVVVQILECANCPNVQIQTHELFTTFSETTMVKDMQVLVRLYAKFTWSRWREVPVMNWLVTNALEVIKQFDSDANIKARAIRLGEERLALFRNHPPEIIRHLCIIRPMADLIVDGAVPNYFRTISGNPAPEVGVGIDRYNYYKIIEWPNPDGATSLLVSFIASLLPEYSEG